MEIDSDLSCEKQNLVFAPNGTGKSFFARALRVLDDYAFAQLDEKSIPESIVSEECDGTSDFALFRGAESLAELKFDVRNKSTLRKSDNYIFHVFSADFIDAELRSKNYEIDGEKIQHEIVVGKENHELDSKREKYAELDAKIDSIVAELGITFLQERRELKQSFSISEKLGAFKSLDIEQVFKDSKDDAIEPLTEIKKQFSSFKGFPSQPENPQEVEVEPLLANVSKILEDLRTPVSISTVGAEIRAKVKSDPEFFQSGLSRFKANNSECPFCTQPIADVAMSAIEQYERYFRDVEARAIMSLSASRRRLVQLIEETERKSGLSAQAAVSFNKLKVYFQEFSKIELDDLSTTCQALKGAYEYLIEQIDRKMENLANVTFDFDADGFDQTANYLRKLKFRNDGRYAALLKSISNLDDERIKIQRRACESMVFQFRLKHLADIERRAELREERAELKVELGRLEKISGSTAPARQRVASTFAQLLKYMFGEKYTFDETKFVVKRNSKDMTRGGNRTLSEGEKSVFAFCYFVAQIHMKVDSNEDYRRLFFIVDDPVSSLSFDYIYNIAQCLKTLRIKNDGSVELDGNVGERIFLLILTHNDYFYNVATFNNLVKSSAVFELKNDGKAHSFVKQAGFVTPHKFHLERVYRVSKELEDVSPSTPNSIRSVVEGLWKFVRPDFQTFADFANHLREAEGIHLRSVLINTYSHGAVFESMNATRIADIKLAADETLLVVERFAPGQLRRLE